MEISQKRRQDSEVGLVIQTTSGNRFEGNFKPTNQLHEILEQLCPDENGHSDLVAVYMRTEITADNFQKTSLKDLGLLDGRAIIRLIRRSPDAAKM